MSKFYFTADTHIGHRGIIEHCHRPFNTVEEMNHVLIDRINQKVGKGDILYIAGDFCLGNFADVKRYRAMINCHAVNLVRGNHDRLSDKQYLEAGFYYKGDMADLKIEGQYITVCHYAMRRWNKSHKGSWCLFGHSHGNLPDDPRLFSFDIGVDCHNYNPLSFDEVKAIMAKRTSATAEANHVRGL